MNSVEVFVNVTDLFGKIYVLKELTNKIQGRDGSRDYVRWIFQEIFDFYLLPILFFSPGSTSRSAIDIKERKRNSLAVVWFPT